MSENGDRDLAAELMSMAVPTGAEQLEPVAEAAGAVGHAPATSDAPLRYPLLDPLRAVAALMVFASHYCIVLWGPSLAGRMVGTLGVAIFFALSGFLLYPRFSPAAVRTRGFPETRSYLLRRAARILPGYWVAFLVSAAVVGLPNVTGSNLLIYLGLLQDYFDSTRYGGITPVWSLSIEASFYLLLPVLGAAFLLVDRVTPQRFPRPEPFLIGAIATLSLLTLAVFPGQPDTIISTLCWFAFGMGIAWSSRTLTGLSDIAPRFVYAVIGAALLVFAAIVSGAVTGNAAVRLGLGLAGAGLVGAAALGQSAPLVRSALNRSPMLWLGRVSYGIFLWHWPVLQALDSLGAVELALASAGLTFALATASFYGLERPIMNRVRRFG